MFIWDVWDVRLGERLEYMGPLKMHAKLIPQILLTYGIGKVVKWLIWTNSEVFILLFHLLH